MSLEMSLRRPAWRRLSISLCCALALAPSPAVLAGEAAAETHYLDEVVVTGTRSARTVSDTPVRTDVVTRQELEKTHARTVAEALEDVAGLQLREIHGKAGKEVWLQGIDADRVLVLIDGLPMTATTGSSVDVTQLSILAVERIEVVKGAVAAQYGSAAMGGVVNIITRDIEPGLAAELTIDGGSYGDQNPSGDSLEPARQSARGMVSGGSEHWRLRLSGAAQHSDGIDPQPRTWHRPADAYDRQQLDARLTWLPSADDEIFANLGAFSEDSESRFRLAKPGGFAENRAKEESVQRLRARLGGQHQRGAGPDWHWNLLHEKLDNDTQKYTPTARFDRRSAEHNLSQASAHTELEIAPAHQLQVGADYRHESLEQSKDGNSELQSDQARVSRSSKELWLQNTWLPSDTWELVAGLRGQYDSDFGEHYAPKLNVRYDLHAGPAVNQYLRASWGLGYRVPNLKERHFKFDHSQLGYVVQGSPELEPESSESVQLGWGLNYRRSAWFEVNLFYNDIDDLIQTERDAEATARRGDGVTVFSYANVARARTRGVETTAGWQFAPGWKLTAGYTYTEADDLSNDQPLTRRPTHQGRLGLDGRTGIAGMSWLVRARAQSSEVVDADKGSTSPGYAVLDAVLNQRFGDHLTVFAGVDNLTDNQRDFDDPNDFGPVAGRFVYLGLTVGFGS